MNNPKFLDTPIEYLKGVGPARAEVLRNELAIHTFGDLLTYFPFRYVDRTRFQKISEIQDESIYYQFKASVIQVQVAGSPRNQRLIVTVKDDSGEIELIWFQGIKWILDKIKNQRDFIVFGKPALFNGRYNIPHPELELPAQESLPVSEMIRPIYTSTEKSKSKGLDYKGIAKLVKNLLLHTNFSITENLTPDLLRQLHLIPRQEAYLNIHFPQGPDLLKKAQIRLKFEELFFIQLRLAVQRIGRHTAKSGNRFVKVGDYLNSFYKNHLTFELTQAQKRVIKEIRADLGSGVQMNRLLQGDVGSGKTLVALMTLLIALDNNYQGCLMAPTEILARQHFNNISGMLKGLNINLRILTGSTRLAERREIFEELKNGNLQILIGTHALIEEQVQFYRLGLVVIDEQHRFGVAQRAKLWEKNRITPHILVMTATPIPRTLAMTLYGDLETSILDEMPPGRKPILTRQIYEQDIHKVYRFLHQQIADRRQIYVVYPLIQDSETLDLKNLMDGFEVLKKEFPAPGYRLAMLHGQMKHQEKDETMNLFLQKKIDILVATTVIEVGVDVPNASVMVIENAERFGLSQLHQLRGRVGRGGDQSYCILVSKRELSADARKRISTMVRTSDGFEIAEADLHLRGPGDLQGTQQSGILNLRIADIVKDERILKVARHAATEILTKDPHLEKPPNDILAHHLALIESHQQNWGLIS